MNHVCTKMILPAAQPAGICSHAGTQIHIGLILAGGPERPAVLPRANARGAQPAADRVIFESKTAPGSFHVCLHPLHRKLPVEGVFAGEADGASESWKPGSRLMSRLPSQRQAKARTGSDGGAGRSATTEFSFFIRRSTGVLRMGRTLDLMNLIDSGRRCGGCLPLSLSPEAWDTK